MPYQMNIAVLSFGILQSGLVSVAILRRKSLHPSSTYLVLFLVVVGLQLTFKVISKGWLWEHARTVYMISYNYGYLIGPLVFLLFRSQRKTPIFTRRDLFHFIPFMLSTILTLADELFGIIYHLPLMSLLPWPSLQLLSMIVYGIAAWKLISIETGETRRTFREFLVYVLIVEMLIVITIAILVRQFQTLPDLRFVFILLTILVYWITYKLISSPSIFSEAREAAFVQFVSPMMPKYANSGLRREESDRIEAALKRMMREEQVFLQPDITIDVVARKLSVTRHHLSQVINQHFGRSFTDLVITWRLSEARNRLTDPRYRDQKISAIAFDLGFSSVSVFTTMFKKRFQLTPSAFRSHGGSFSAEAAS